MTQDLGLRPELDFGESELDGFDLCIRFSELWMVGERKTEKLSSDMLMPNLPLLQTQDNSAL